jgi:hypothetical protein
MTCVQCSASSRRLRPCFQAIRRGTLLFELRTVGAAAVLIGQVVLVTVTNVHCLVGTHI